MPTTNTTGNSSPLAACMVIITTASSSGLWLSRSVYRAISSKKPARDGSPSALSRYPWMEVSSSRTFSSRVRLSTSFLALSIAEYPVRAVTSS